MIRFLILTVLVSCTITSYAGDPSMTGLKTRIETPKFQECVAFYRDVIGMTVLDEWDDVGDRGAILGFGSSAAGEAFIEIAHSETNTGLSGVSLQFRVSDLDAVAASLEGRWAYG